MRKEVTFAIFFGITFGLIIAFGVWRLNSSLSKGDNQTAEDNNPSDPNSPNNSSGLTIAKPNDFAVSRTASIEIEGATKLNSWITLSGEGKDSITKTSEDGGFQEKLDLSAGLNQIVIASIDESDEITTKNLTLVYSSQFPEQEANNNEATGSAGVSNRVQERLEEAKHSPIAYIGTITDIFETTIHIRNSNDEIKQVAVKDGTTLANEITKKETKLSELAIGDYVVAMGYINGNQVLNSRRILVTSEPKSPTRQIHVGSVVEIKNKVMALNKKDGSAELIFPKKWSGPDVKEIKEEDKVIVVSDLLEGKNTIRTIEIISE